MLGASASSGQSADGNQKIALKDVYVALNKKEEKSPDTLEPDIQKGFRAFWSKEDVAATMLQEHWSARAWRAVASIAGILQPLGTKDWERAIKTYGGDEDRIMREFLSKSDAYGPSLVLNSTEMPFDAYRLMKGSSIHFIVILVALYFALLSMIFGAVGRSYDCDMGFDALIPEGFLLLSGARSFQSQSVACVWVESIAHLVGVYFSIPLFGAALLVRVLAPHEGHLQISNRMLLTKRKGVPVMMLRAMTTTGTVFTNFSLQLWVVIRNKDEETGEGYGEYVECMMNAPPMLDTCQNISCKLSEDSELIKQGAVYIDENNNPCWNHDKLVRVRIAASADMDMGTHTTVSNISWFDLKYHLIHARADGALPVWQSAMINFPGEWFKSKGHKTPLLDLAKLSEFEYKQKACIAAASGSGSGSG